MFRVLVTKYEVLGVKTCSLVCEAEPTHTFSTLNTKAKIPIHSFKHSTIWKHT